MKAARTENKPIGGLRLILRMVKPLKLLGGLSE
mgnify:CR=1 FL=1